MQHHLRLHPSGFVFKNFKLHELFQSLEIVIENNNERIEEKNSWLFQDHSAPGLVPMKFPIPHHLLISGRGMQAYIF